MARRDGRPGRPGRPAVRHDDPAADGSARPASTTSTASGSGAASPCSEANDPADRDPRRETMGRWDQRQRSSSSCIDGASSSTVSGSRSCRCGRRRPSGSRRRSTTRRGTSSAMSKGRSCSAGSRGRWRSRPVQHTLLLIDLPQIAKDPFDASPTSPILIINTDLGRPTPAAIEALHAQLPQTDPSEGSVRLTTTGFDRALERRRPVLDPGAQGRPHLQGEHQLALARAGGQHDRARRTGHGVAPVGGSGRRGRRARPARHRLDAKLGDQVDRRGPGARRRAHLTGHAQSYGTRCAR